MGDILKEEEEQEEEEEEEGDDRLRYAPPTQYKNKR